jgi:cytochrome c oxidase assembly factor CtaG
VETSTFGALVRSWSFEPRLVAGLLLAALLYFRGWRRAFPLRATQLPPWRLAVFLAGLAALFLALASPLDAFARLLLSAHMAQHLLLMAVAPPLVLLGAPLIPLLRGLPRWAARDALSPFLGWPPLRRFAHSLTHPVLAWIVMTLAMVGWHLPPGYQLALRSPFWHGLEHACFFWSSLLFWWPVVRPWPSRPHVPAWALPPYLLLADLLNTALAAFFTFSDRLLYPVYAEVPRLFGLSALDDQVLAGVLMWVPGSLAFLVPAMVVTWRLLTPRGTEDPVTPARRPTTASARAVVVGFDLLRAPLVGSLLRARYGRRALQAVMLVLAAAVIVDGFASHSMAPMNLAGVLPWTYWRGLTVVALLVAGNLFCMACPFMLPRELGRRLGMATRRWPKRLRSKWLAVLLLGVFFWAYEAFDLWDKPAATAWIVVAYFAGAFAVDAAFRGATFCKYVCPIGQFHFVSSLVSPLEVKVRRPDACASCATHDCLRGNADRRGCELHLYLPRKAGNLDCTFCLDCVKACPYDNIGILAVAPGSDLVRDPIRSAVGRLSRRPDVAALALVFVFGAFANAGAMAAPVAAWRDALAAGLGFASTLPVNTALFAVALVLLPALSIRCAVAAGRFLGHSTLPGREVASRLSLALVPLGLTMWAAHFLFHGLSGWSSAWPVVQRVAGDLGWTALGSPSWTMPSPLLGAGQMLALLVLLLDLGLLLSLYVGWRIARAMAPRPRSALGLVAPWASLAVALYAAGVWVFLQPMPMRGMVH